MIIEYLIKNFINTFASVIAGIGNWVFGFLILKYTDTETLSIYTSFMALLLISALSGHWIQLMSVRLGTEFRYKITNWYKSNKILFLSGVSIATAALLFLFIVAELPILLFPLLIFILSLINLISYYRGLLQHYTDFFKLSLFTTIDIATKLIILLIFLSLNLTFAAAFVAIAVQYALSFIILRHFVNQVDTVNEDLNIKKESYMTLVYGFGFIFMTNIDLFFIRVFLEEELGKNYIGILQLIKVLFFAVTALISVLLPYLQKFKKNSQIYKLSAITAGAIISGAIGLFGILSVFYPQLSELLEFQNIEKSLALRFLVFCTILCLSQITLTILLVKESRALLISTILAAVAQILLYSIYARDLESFINTYGITAIVLFVFSFIFTLRQLKVNYE